MSDKVKRLTTAGVAVAAALIISYIESLFPLSVAVPGIKLGLANIVIVFVLYKLDLKYAAAVSLIRVLLAGLLFGSAASMAYAASGAFLAFIVMVLMKKARRFSAVGVSCAGAVAHNIGQILMAMLLLDTAQIAYYLPVLLMSGVITGIAIGAVGAILINRIRLKI